MLTSFFTPSSTTTTVVVIVITVVVIIIVIIIVIVIVVVAVVVVALCMLDNVSRMYACSVIDAARLEREHPWRDGDEGKRGRRRA